ncbi:hypothetical protein CLU79DRAFT_773664 [Phycomyces nitens]|nr:hypothetical protein CLU79DRAFT_773664 [Phycomyces nitens]
MAVAVESIVFDDEDNGDSINYVAPEPIVNDMNDHGQDRLLKYLDPEFLDATPDSKTKFAEEIEAEEEFDLDDDLEENEGEDEKLVTMMCPREYQFELYQRALEDNVIAVLDTGSGKTLISVMLIKEIAAREREARMTRRSTKLAFFLVDRVPLVFQQSEVIKANCDVVLEQMCGEMNVDNWSEKKWKTIYEESDVCVMTAQIFLDTLRHGFITMNSVNLIVFDECHHATKKHPYNLIMREFYDRCRADERPKIFGMTASPMHSKTGVYFSATQLEYNLNSRIYTAANLEELQTAVKLPDEYEASFSPSPGFPPTELSKRAREKLNHIKRFERVFQVTTEVADHLGPWCGDRLWQHILENMVEKMLLDTKGQPRENLCDDDQALYEIYQLSLTEAPSNPDILNKRIFTPKTMKLLQLLKILRGLPEFCGIIFVERRHTAIALNLLINSIDLFETFNCDLLIGHGTSEEGDTKMGYQDQNKMIKKFRSGELNLLIATNVAEEGLDIQPCNVVIRFDFFTTLIAYIQSRGRARKPDSKYIILTDESNMGQRGMLSRFRDLENEMKMFCRMLPEDRNVANKFLQGMPLMDDNGDSDESEDEDCEKVFIVPTTGAMITMESSVPLLHRYCGTLPSDQFSLLKPVFEITSTSDGFQCIVHLPTNAAVIGATSEPTQTKLTAKKLAALETCILLFEAKAFNDHLLPNNPKRELLGEMAPLLDKNGMVVGSRRRRGVYEKRTPRFWKRVVEEVEIEDEELNPSDPKDDAVFDTNPETALVNLQPRIKPEKKKKGGLSHMPLAIDEVEDVDGLLNPENQSNETIDPRLILPMLEEDDDGPFTLWFSVIDINVRQIFNGHVRRMCLLTWKPFPVLPEIELYSQGRTFTAIVHPLEESVDYDVDTILALSHYNLKLSAAITNKEFVCQVREFPYFLVPLTVNNGQEITPDLSTLQACQDRIDWEEIKRTVEQKDSKIDLTNPSELALEDTIITDAADGNRRYFVKKVLHEMRPQSAVPVNEGKVREVGYATFEEYYEKEHDMHVTFPDQPLISVQKVSKVMNYLQPAAGVLAQQKGRTANYVVPEFCQKVPISASVYQSMMLIPSLMTRLDSFLLANEARERYKIPISDIQMLEAYTAPSASMKMDYERLETLGDSLLKFIATIRLYINFPFCHEGELHCLRIRVICNRALYRSAKRLKIYRYVTSQAFNRRYWRPHGFVAKSDTLDTLKETKTHMLSDKTLADVVEATLGAAYLSSGLEGGLDTAIAMQIPFDEMKQWSDFLPTYIDSRKSVPARAEIKALRSVNLPKVYEVTGYTFNQPLLLVEALTHASLPNSTAPCYQRLEFLGDAILDFLVIRYLFTKYPTFDPGMITDIKDSCVNNHVLGIICIETGMHKHIIHYSSRLVRAIEHFVSEVDELKQKGEAVGEYWRDFSIPKVLSDIVESMLGAVFVDAGFNLEPVEKLDSLPPTCKSLARQAPVQKVKSVSSFCTTNLLHVVRLIMSRQHVVLQQQRLMSV